MIPILQNPSNNEAWPKVLSQDILRHALGIKNKVHVLNGQMKTIGDEHVAVPNQFYKILIDNNTGKTKMIALLMPHKESNKPLYEFVVSVDTIEKLTGIDFFPQLDDKTENKLEALSSYKGWSFD